MNSQEILNFVLASGAIVGGIAYAGGQWISSRRKGANDALGVAMQEVAAIKLRVTRIEEENQVLLVEIERLSKENGVLKDLLLQRGDAELKFNRYLDSLFERQTRQIVDAVNGRAK